MNVLVVDDQYDVVQGILQGVDWASLNVRHVFSAFGVEEACAILRDQMVHVLLCDIEIPPRNGFEVLSWIQKHHMPTQCIFLTAHAKFEYAQTAIKMGSFDYLLLPARYEDIASAVARARARFEEAQQVEQTLIYGQYWKQDEEILISSSLERFLRGGEPQDPAIFLTHLMRFQVRLFDESIVTLALVQPLGAAYAQEPFCELKQALGERIHNANQPFLVSDLGDDGLLFFFYGEGNEWSDILLLFQREQEAMEAQGRRFACYLGGNVNPRALREEYACLLRRKRENVAGYSGVFAPSQKQEVSRYIYTFPDMQRWASILMDGRCEDVRAEALHALRKCREGGFLDATFLAKFYQDFTQMFFATVRHFERTARDIFYDEYPLKGFLDAYTSYEKMIAMVDYAIRYIDEHVSLPTAEISPVQKAIGCIQKNIERNISCLEIAQMVHMNASYLTRLFKKEMKVSLNEFIIKEKMRVASSLLEVTSIPVSLVAAKVGYSNFSYFSQVFRREVGCSPLEYRQRHSKP